MEKTLSKIIVGKQSYVQKEVASYLKRGWTIVNKTERFNNYVTITLQLVRVY